MPLERSELPPQQPDPLVGKLAPQTPARVMAYGILAAVLLYIVSSAALKSYSASFFAAPFFVGFIVGVLSLKHPFKHALFTLLGALLLGVVTLREGVVCVLFSLPLVLPMTMLGTASGWTIRRHLRARKYQYWVAGLALLANVGWQGIEGALDDPGRHPVQTADSALEIAATPEEVFAALTARELTVASRWPWFLRIGLPMPRRMVLEGAGVGSAMRLEFSQGTAHARVTRWEPGRALAFTVERYAIDDLPFHITRLGRGPHWGLRTERVEDWLTLLALEYTLEPTPAGATVLRRHTAWRRHLAPGFYFAWLQQVILQRGQNRLLELIRDRVESAPDANPPTTSARAHRPR